MCWWIFQLMLAATSCHAIRLRCSPIQLAISSTNEIIYEVIRRWPLENAHQLARLVKHQYIDFSIIYDSIDEVSELRVQQAQNLFFQKPHLHEALFSIKKMQGKTILPELTIFSPNFNLPYYGIIASRGFKPVLFSYSERQLLIKLMKSGYPSSIRSNDWQKSIMHGISNDKERMEIFKEVWPIIDSFELVFLLERETTRELLYSAIFSIDNQEVVFFNLIKIALAFFNSPEMSNGTIIIKSSWESLLSETSSKYHKALPWDLLELFFADENLYDRATIVEKLGTLMLRVLKDENLPLRDNFLHLSSLNTFLEFVCWCALGKREFSIGLLKLLIEIGHINPQDLTLPSRQYFLEVINWAIEKYRDYDLGVPYHLISSPLWTENTTFAPHYSILRFCRTNFHILSSTKKMIELSKNVSKISLRSLFDILQTQRQRNNGIALNLTFDCCVAISKDYTCTWTLVELLKQLVDYMLRSPHSPLIKWTAKCLKSHIRIFSTLALTLEYMLIGSIGLKSSFLPPPFTRQSKDLLGHFQSHFKQIVCPPANDGPTLRNNTSDRYASILYDAIKRIGTDGKSWNQILEALERKI